MFGVSFPELLLVLLVVLLVFGPELARQLGKWSSFLRNTSDSVRRDFYNSMYTPAEEIRKELEEEKLRLRAVGNEVEKDLQSQDSSKGDEKGGNSVE